jgi:chitin disaccharide deacetylase
LKRLVVNADDFGYARDVNAGIVEAHRNGILTATTLMANGAAFDDAVELARSTPEMDVGCHLVLVGGRSLLAGQRPFPKNVPELLKRLALRQISPYDELRAQVERIIAAGIRPTHLDTHKHTHIAFPVLDAVARLGEEFGIVWVRRPFDFPLSGSGSVPWSKRMVSGSLQVLRSRFHSKLARHGCKTTDYFAGFQLTGYLNADELAGLIRSLPEGTTEFMCHPGYCTDELRACRTRLKESRERELAALTAQSVKSALVQAGVRLTRYRDLNSVL